MHGKPTDEFHIVQGHFQLFGSESVILVGEHSLCGANVQYPVVGDSNFVGISSQVFEHSLWMAERPFGINHLFFSEQGIYEFLFRLNPGFEGLYILCPEDFAHGFDGK